MDRFASLALLCLACGGSPPVEAADAGPPIGDGAMCDPPLAPSYPEGQPVIEYSDAYAAEALPSWWVWFQMDRLLNQRADALGCCRAFPPPAPPRDACGALELWWPTVVSIQEARSCDELVALAATAFVCAAQDALPAEGS